MATIVMDMNECDLVHETLMLKEFGEAAAYVSPGLYSSGKDAVAKYGKPARAGSKHLKAVASAPEKVIGKIPVLSSAFPKCP